MKTIHPTLALLMSCLAVAGCTRAPAQDALAAQWQVSGERLQPRDPAAVLGVRLGQVTEADAGFAHIPGRLLWADESTARVFTPFNGRVERILVEPGQQVSRGQPLLQLASSDYGQAQADARKADADLRVAQRQFARTRDLLQDGVVAGKDFEQAESDLRHAEAEDSRAGARLRAAGDRRVEVDGTFTLLAPFKGVVVGRLVNAGTEVRADAASPLFVITDPSRMLVQIDLPEMLSAALAVGQDVEFSISSLPGRIGHARITSIAAEVDPLTQTVHARGAVMDDTRALRGESFIEARIPLPADSGASVRVPADAVVLVGERHFVFAQQDQGYVRVPVTIAALGSDAVEVSGGLRAGESVVVDGALYLEQLFESGGRI